MRLINADALSRKVKKECNPYGKPSIDFESGKRVLEMIDFMPTIPAAPKRIGRWVKDTSVYASPGGAPAYICGSCGGSEHLYGVEFSRRKVICDSCGRINVYPWEKVHEQGSSLWEDDE